MNVDEKTNTSPPSETSSLNSEHMNDLIRASSSAPNLQVLDTTPTYSLQVCVVSLSLFAAIEHSFEFELYFQIDDMTRVEADFVNYLIEIGNKLNIAQTKFVKSKLLITELYLLNQKLPARVWLPLYSDINAHLVLRIPYTEGCVLNSKDRSPYCFYCEVIEVENVETASLPEDRSYLGVEMQKQLAQSKWRRKPGVAY